MNDTTQTVMSLSAPVEQPRDGPILADENIDRLARRVAKYVIRPRGVGMDDAAADAAVILIEMRARWSEEKSAHLPVERAERMAIAWARLRLIDQYEPLFARQKLTKSLMSMDRDSPDLIIDSIADDPPPRITDMDREEIRAVVQRLPRRFRDVVQMTLFEGLTQPEIAERLGVSQAAISVSWSEARAKLANMLREFAPKVGGPIT